MGPTKQEWRDSIYLTAGGLLGVVLVFLLILWTDISYSKPVSAKVEGTCSARGCYRPAEYVVYGPTYSKLVCKEHLGPEFSDFVNILLIIAVLFGFVGITSFVLGLKEIYLNSISWIYKEDRANSQGESVSVCKLCASLAALSAAIAIYILRDGRSIALSMTQILLLLISIVYFVISTISFKSSRLLTVGMIVGLGASIMAMVISYSSNDISLGSLTFLEFLLQVGAGGSYTEYIGHAKNQI